MDGPGSATDLAKRIEAMSNGRLKIQVFGAGELIPALEGFDAVRAGTVEMNHANSYFWTGKTFAAQYFTAVPFGLNFQGMNGWLYDGGGMQLWNEVYAPFGMVAFPCGNTGVQMTGWFKKEIKSVADFKGLKMRIPGLAGKVYATLGVDVKLLPGGEIFPALERGVIDAAEFVGPYQDRRLGPAQGGQVLLHHRLARDRDRVASCSINKAAWDKLPKDLQAIVENACAACNVISEAWCQRTNAEAMEDLVKNQGVIARPLPDDVVKALREATQQGAGRSRGQGPGRRRRCTTRTWPSRASTTRWAGYSEAVYHEQDPWRLMRRSASACARHAPAASTRWSMRIGRCDVVALARHRRADGDQRAAALSLQHRLGVVAGARVAPARAAGAVRHDATRCGTASTCASTCSTRASPSARASARRPRLGAAAARDLALLVI